MGRPEYNVTLRAARATSEGYETKGREEIFRQRDLHPDMDPNGIKIREARDSELHPNSLPIIFALDVTGSMGVIPHELIKHGLPHIMTTIIGSGEKDPQLLFLAIGDHKCDRAPLQVGQFESGDAELDMWLTKTWLEGHGGGNRGESYFLAWYFAAMHTVTDAWEKRHKKGFLFTVGDEFCHKDVPANAITTIMGNVSKLGESTTEKELLKLAQEKWHVYHFEMNGGDIRSYWQNLLGENCIQISSVDEISKRVAEIVTQDMTPFAMVPTAMGSVPDVEIPSML